MRFLWALLLVPLALAKPRCGVNEEFVQCGTLCFPTCDQPLPKKCPFKACLSGCQCVSGYVRSKEGLCVRPSFCPPAVTPAPPTLPPTLAPVQPTLPPVLPPLNPPVPKKLPEIFPLPPTILPEEPKVTFCQSLPDGKYADPEVDCAQHFFFCEKGEAMKMDCVRGTYFDAITGDCLFRQWVEACGGQSTPRPKATIPPPRDEPFPFDCSDKADGNYEHPTEQCSAVYVACSGGEVEYMECQEGLAFDVLSNKCLNPAYVPWCPGGVATPEPKPLPPQDATIPPFEFDCWGKADGNYEHPTQPCSAEYVSCVGFEPTFRVCPGALKFDSISGNCLLAPYVATCPGGETTVTPKTIQPDIPQNPGIIFECGGKADGDYPHPTEQCSPFYFSCSGGVSRFRFCPAPTKFDVLSGECQEEIWTAGCGGQSTPKPKTPKPEIPLNPPFEFDCSTKVDGDYDHPTNPCSQDYVSCSGGVAKHKTCPGSLVFDWDTVRCLDSQFVAGCGGKPTPPQDQSTVSPRPKVDFQCAGQADGYYPNPREACSQRFYSCVGGEAMAMYCPGALAWDISSGDCVEQIYVEACGGQPTPKTPVPKFIPTTPANPPAAFDCSGLVPGNYPAEEGCSQRFFTCDATGFATESVCGDKTFFDADSQQCLFRRNVKACGGGLPPTPPFPQPKTPRPTPPPPFQPTLRPLPPKKTVQLPSKSFDCGNRANGLYGERCAQTFTFCVDQQAEPGFCGNKFFDGVSRCVSRDLISC